MRVLLLAPQPFYTERGTPIAVNLLIRALSERGDRVDLVTFHEGEDVSHPGLEIHRCAPVPDVHDVRPGFSVKKLVCDVALARTARALMGRERYDVVHAIEEAAFIARWLCAARGVPFVYDMDSSMSDQLVDAIPALRGFRTLLHTLEAGPIRSARAVVPMCEALAEVARRRGAREVHVLKDVSLAGREASGAAVEAEDLRATRGLGDGPIAMYIGNLERYQGIDLLIDGFSIAAAEEPTSRLVIIGGADADIARYRERISRLGLGARAVLVGRRPVAAIGAYMRQADLLVSPRTKGTNTPMKLYSYLDSGVAVLATDLPTHTQVASAREAMLAPPDVQAFGEAMVTLFRDEERRAALATEARELIRREHSYEAFRRSVHALYDWLERGAVGSGAPS